MEEGKPVAAKVLPPSDEEAVRLLKALKGYHFSLSQYFGHSSVSIKRNLIVYEGIKVPESWAPCFKDESSYGRTNVVLTGYDETGHTRAAIASYNLHNRRLEPPLKMDAIETPSH